MYRVVIKQLQLSFLPVLANISQFSTPYSDFLSLFLRLSRSPHLPLPVSRPPYFLSPRLSSFWTLSRCACGNFPGVIFAALLARSLTSLSSVFTPVVIFLSFHPLSSAAFSSPIKNGSPSPYSPPLSYSHPVSHFHERPRQTLLTKLHVFPRARLSFPFPFFIIAYNFAPGLFRRRRGGCLFSGSRGRE